MSVDERLRAGLAEAASRLPEPDLEMRFHRSLAIHRRRRSTRRLSAAAALVAACTVVGIAVIGPDRPGLSWPTADSPSRLDSGGSYTGLAPGLPGVPGSAGQWRLDVADDGQVTASAPVGADRGPAAAGWLRGGRLTTDLFSPDACNGAAPGTYTVKRVADRLVLQADQDRCPARVRLLTTTNWVSALNSSWQGPTIPEGRWSKEVDVAELRQGGLDLGPATLRANFLDDGRGRFHLDISGTKLYVFVEDDDGTLVLGDEADTSYDALGRLVQNLDLALEWTLEGDTLVIGDIAPVQGVRLTEATPEERLALEGTWRRAG
ncbi:hypothetical protein [Oryzobacter terrae]|uniref:hypothetical protein n=1 Tax=Oryzobacter terrae TaxID=1620385 RepID=UPI00366A55BE